MNYRNDDPQSPEETDRYWNAIVGNGGQESQCGWCKDKWGISWQITPRVLADALAAGGDEAKRVIGHLTKLAPLERLGRPEDIASTVAFLAGPDGAWINGQVLRANGGII